MADTPTIDTSITPADVYGGGLMPISIDKLVNNETAIAQVLNERYVLATEVERLRKETGLLKASPFISALGATVGVLGTVVVGLGFGWVFGEHPSNVGYCCVVAGGLLMLIGALSTYFFQRWAQRQ